jgi:hypothetical protein
MVRVILSKHNNVCLVDVILLNIRKRHVSTCGSHHQVFLQVMLKTVYIIRVPGGWWRDLYIGPLLLLSIWYIGGSLGDCGKEECPLLSIQFLVKVVSMGPCVMYRVWFSWVSFSLLYWILVAERLWVTLVGLVPSCGGWRI